MDGIRGIIAALLFMAQVGIAAVFFHLANDVFYTDMYDAMDSSCVEAVVGMLLLLVSFVACSLAFWKIRKRK